MNASTLRTSCLTFATWAMVLFGSGSGGVLPVVSAAWAEPAPPSVAKEALEVSIAIPSHAGEKAVYANVPKRDFHVLVTNVSDHPVNVWEEWCSWGYFSLSFELTDGSGKTWTVKKKPAAFTRNVPACIAVGSHESLVLDVKFTDHETWEDFPIPAKGHQTLTMKAVFEVEESKESQKYSVWTGRIVSQMDKYVFYHSTR